MHSSSMRIHFVARDLAATWPDLDQFGERDIAAHAARFRGGVNNWIVQTFLRLRAPLAAAGITPTIGETLIADCVNVAHRDCLNRPFEAYFRSFIVGIRADRSPVHWCDIEVVQNELEPMTARMEFLNFRPQPGLIARDPSRGCRVRRVAYFGRASNAPAWFGDPAWHRALAAMGMVCEIRDDRWFDYSDVDVVLSHRTGLPTVLRQKPANKLINAWLAGTPALLADEPAYANLRRNSLDYYSTDTPADALAWLERLHTSPGQFAAMVANGRLRGAEFSIEATKARWMRFLLDRVVPEATAWHGSRRGFVATRLTHLARATRHKLAAKHFKLKVLLESRRRSSYEPMAPVTDSRWVGTANVLMFSEAQRRSRSLAVSPATAAPPASPSNSRRSAIRRR